jgi:mannose-1-phosphate guanylyltransferase/phosphomannomutase
VKALVLCAGLGTRLGPLTAETPKAMLPVGGEPLLAHTLRHLARHGIHDVAVNLHFRGESIRTYFGRGAPFGVRLRYLDEPSLLGTAGTVRWLAPNLDPKDELLVLYGDLLLDQDFGELARVHRDRAADATLLLHQRLGSNSLVRMEDDGRISAFLERPTEEQRRASPHPWVNSGVAILGLRAREAIPAQAPADLPRDVWMPSVERLRLFGVPLSGYRCAVDSPQRLAEADAAFREGRYDPRKPLSDPSAP